MIESGERLLLAVSGGPDSVALLCVFRRLADEYRLCITAAHLNHGLRGQESRNEETFVRDLCIEMGVNCICKTLEREKFRKKNGRSLEEICRDERYLFLGEAARTFGAKKIATAHHREDQAETVLINLLRGCGPEGLKGMLPVRDGRIIRPFLNVHRFEILDFLKREGLEYKNDSSNRNNVFVRNRIRNVLIPELKAHYNPGLITGLCRTAEIIRREDGYMHNIAGEVIARLGIDLSGEGVTVPIEEFSKLHEALQYRIIKLMLESLTPGRNGIGYRHIDSVCAFFYKAGDRRLSLDLPNRMLVEREGNILRMRKQGHKSRRQRKNEAPPGYEYRVEIPSTVHLADINREIRFELIEKPEVSDMKRQPHAAFIDYESVNKPLIVRNMKPGDRIDPLGMKGTKKVNEYFIDRKVSSMQRQKVPLLVDSISVIWIGGERISHRVRVRRGTKKVLKAEMI